MKHKRKTIPFVGKTKFGKKAGLAPGTPAYFGKERSFQTRVDLIEYSENTFDKKNDILLSSSELNKKKETDAVRWLNVKGVHQPEIIEEFGKTLNLHSLVIEDIVHTEQRPKLDEYDEYIYLVVKMMDFQDHGQDITTEQLSIIMKDNTLITFIEDEGDLFEPLRERIKKGNPKIRKSGADYLLYSMLDMIVDHYFLVLEKIGDRLEEIEFQILENSNNGSIEKIHQLKRELLYLRKSIWPMREVIGLLSRSDNNYIRGNTYIYLRDVYDHCVHAIDSLETYRDLSSSLMDVYLSSLSNKMNGVMKTLTIIATIFIPLTFLVGVYGMNFDMPEYQVGWTYPLLWIFMVLVSGGMIWYFRKKDWF